MAQQGYFVITDITGYTAFLTGSELEHAQDILKSLFDTLLDSIKQPLLISNFQGDAILTYAPLGTFQRGETLLEMVETIYSDFTRKRELMHYNTTCTCKACANMQLLDLKFFVHFGEYMIQDMRGKAEISGPDVIVAHRMMKNQVRKDIGFQAYTLFTEKAIKSLALEEFTCEMEPYSENYDHIGEIKMYAYCMKTMWEKQRDFHREKIPAESAWLKLGATFDAPPSVIWDCLQDPQKRLVALDVQRVTVSGKRNGRTGVSATYHCAHDNSTITNFTIVDLQPFEYITEHVTGLPLNLEGTMTTYLRPKENMTYLEFCFQAPSSTNPITNIVARMMDSYLRRSTRRDYEKFLRNFKSIIP